MQVNRAVLELQARQAVNLCVDAGDTQTHLVKQKFTAELGQGWPRQGAGFAQKGRHVIKLHVLQIGADAKFTFGWVGHGHVVNAPAHPKIDRCGRAGAHRFFQITAHIGQHRQRQIPVQPGEVGAGQLRGQVKHARETLDARLGFAGVPMALDLALRVGVGQGQFVEPHIPAFTLVLPAQLAVQTLQWQAAFFKYARQVQCTVAHLHFGAAPLLVGTEAHQGAFNPGTARHGVRAIQAAAPAGLALERQATQFAFQRITALPPRGIHSSRCLPAAIHLVQHAHRLELRQRLVQRWP